MKTIENENEIPAETKLAEDVANAIAESIERNRIVRLETTNMRESMTEVLLQSDSCDSAPTREGVEYWGECNGRDFRLVLIEAE